MKLEQGNLSITEYSGMYQLASGVTHIQLDLTDLLYLYVLVKAVIDITSVDVTGKTLTITHHPSGKRELVLS